MSTSTVKLNGREIEVVELEFVDSNSILELDGCGESLEEKVVVDKSEVNQFIKASRNTSGKLIKNVIKDDTYVMYHSVDAVLGIQYNASNNAFRAIKLNLKGINRFNRFIDAPLDIIDTFVDFFLHIELKCPLNSKAIRKLAETGGTRKEDLLSFNMKDKLGNRWFFSVLSFLPEDGSSELKQWQVEANGKIIAVIPPTLTIVKSFEEISNDDDDII